MWTEEQMETYINGIFVPVPNERKKKSLSWQVIQQVSLSVPYVNIENCSPQFAEEAEGTKKPACQCLSIDIKTISTIVTMETEGGMVSRHPRII